MEDRSLQVDLAGKQALVTGGASGIGRACAQHLAAAGAGVTVVDIDAPKAREVAGEIGGEAVHADLTDPGVFAGLPSHVDILVNNAGIQHVAPVEEFPPEVFHRIWTLMVGSAFQLSRHVLPHMYAHGWGRIINISSAHGLRASPYKSAYVSAKHGLEGLSKVLALEGGARGVTSNTICPAYVRTPLVEKQIVDQARTHGISEDRVIEDIMLTEPAIKRLIEPDEVGELAVFLCSPPASFMNGSSLVVDGGWTAK
ncbi:MAG TPA: 3-hydroxybutyrate dehydrogenase [Euzebyales bacterium]|nr:3-hydroxybutyrate dehydrogenase [Euzebyales bacterium]